MSCSSCSARSAALVASSALRELLGERLSPGLRLVELALQFTAGLVQAEQFVHVEVDALNPDGRLYGFRVVPDESSVQHGGNATRSGAPRAEDDGHASTVEGMLVTNHVLSGAAIGAAVRRPVPGFALGVASHFALDAAPHWGKFGGGRRYLRVAVPDGLAGLAVMVRRCTTMQDDIRRRTGRGEARTSPASRCPGRQASTRCGGVEGVGEAVDVRMERVEVW